MVIVLRQFFCVIVLEQMSILINGTYFCDAKTKTELYLYQWQLFLGQFCGMPKINQNFIFINGIYFWGSFVGCQN